MDIQVFHRYNKLARRNLVPTLLCDVCDNEWTLRATEDGEPVLQCFFCDTLTQPGLAMYDRMVAINREFYL